MPTILASKQVVAGIMALLLLLNINVGGGKVDTEVYMLNHLTSVEHIEFYGTYQVGDNRLPIVVKVDTAEEKDDEEPTEKKERKENAKDDMTPGKVEIVIDGKKVVYKRDIGNGDLSDFEKEQIEEIRKSIVSYIDKIDPHVIEGKKVKSRLQGFVDYCKKPKKSLFGRIFSWL